MIEESHKITIESERIGMEVMDDLQRDREKIQRSQRRVSHVYFNEENLEIYLEMNSRLFYTSCSPLILII